jgi:hypothetical protein
MKLIESVTVPCINLKASCLFLLDNDNNEIHRFIALFIDRVEIHFLKIKSKINFAVKTNVYL